jgi:hypothetical protein
MLKMIAQILLRQLSDTSDKSVSLIISYPKIIFWVEFSGHRR